MAERRSVLVVEAKCREDWLRGHVVGTWVLGNPGGEVLGVLLWLQHEQHVLVVCGEEQIGYWSSWAHGGKLEQAPWRRYVVAAPKKKSNRGNFQKSS